MFDLRNDSLEILYEPESQKTSPIAYFVYGIPKMMLCQPMKRALNSNLNHSFRGASVALVNNPPFAQFFMPVIIVIYAAFFAWIAHTEIQTTNIPSLGRLFEPNCYRTQIKTLLEAIS